MKVKYEVRIRPENDEIIKVMAFDGDDPEPRELVSFTYFSVFQGVCELVSHLQAQTDLAAVKDGRDESTSDAFRAVEQEIVTIEANKMLRKDLDKARAELARIHTLGSVSHQMMQAVNEKSLHDEKDALIQSLRQEVDKLNQQLVTAREDLATAERSAVYWNKACNQSDKEAEKAEKELADLRSDFDRLNAQYHALKGEHATLGSNYSGLVVEHGKLKDAHDELRAALETARVDRNFALAHLEQVRAELAQLRSAVGPKFTQAPPARNPSATL